MTEKRKFKWVGQRLFCELPIRPAEQARLVGVSRAHVGNWRSGANKPDDESRRRIHAQWSSVAPEFWDRADEQPPATSAPASAATSDPQIPQPPTDAEVPVLGVVGLELLIAEARRNRRTLSPKEAFESMRFEAHVQVQRERLLVERRNARSEFLASNEFADDIRQFARLLGAGAYEKLRKAVRKQFTLELPQAADDVPTDAFTLETITPILEKALLLEEHNEPYLAMRERIRLRLDERKHRIAQMLVAEPEETITRFIKLCCGQDELTLTQAVELRYDTMDICGLDDGTRALVASLLEKLSNCGPDEIIEIAREVMPSERST